MTGSWRRLVFANPDVEPGWVEKVAYSFCVLEHLHRALRRRDVFARDGDRWGDPPAKSPAGDRWEITQPTVLTALGLEAEPAAHLAELGGALHGAYHRVVAGLPTNSAVTVKDGKPQLDRLGPAAEPNLMPAFRQPANSMLPKVDFPDLLLEVAELTGMTAAFTHISGADPHMNDAFAHYGRIFKTLHLLQFISDDGYRRMIGKQLNITEARHRLARRIFFGQRGKLRQNYREGMEDQLGALGLALNAVVLWNSLYLDRAAKQFAADRFPVTDDLLARLSPLQFRNEGVAG